MKKTREESMEEAIKVARLLRQFIQLVGFVLLTDLDRKCMVLKDTVNNEEFAFSAGGELLDKQ